MSASVLLLWGSSFFHSTPLHNCLVFLQYRCSFKGMQWFSSEYGLVSSLITLHEGEWCLLARYFSLWALKYFPEHKKEEKKEKKRLASTCLSTLQTLFPTTHWGILDRSSQKGNANFNLKPNIICQVNAGLETGWKRATVWRLEQKFWVLLMAGSGAQRDPYLKSLHQEGTEEKCQTNVKYTGSTTSPLLGAGLFVEKGLSPPLFFFLLL